MSSVGVSSSADARVDSLVPRLNDSPRSRLFLLGSVEIGLVDAGSPGSPNANVSSVSGSDVPRSSLSGKADATSRVFGSRVVFQSSESDQTCSDRVTRCQRVAERPSVTALEVSLSLVPSLPKVRKLPISRKAPVVVSRHPVPLLTMKRNVPISRPKFSAKQRTFNWFDASPSEGSRPTLSHVS